MIWEDFTVENANFGAEKKKLIHGITGFAEPARIMAAMGPSCCGKTTFLDSLTWRGSGDIVEGRRICIGVGGSTTFPCAQLSQREIACKWIVSHTLFRCHPIQCLNSPHYVEKVRNHSSQFRK
ncbi:hypothetical protein Fmac_010377 [Flemingia macrophylla]|uniref:ABC transporter domain-containing protein n=1 Tax=Flemingia macrophylla TaxID=520843 RepID=A0ABD1MJE7_9FABA